MVQDDLEESGGNPLVGSTFCLGQDESVNDHIWCHRCLDIFHSSLFYGQAFNPLPSAKPPTRGAWIYQARLPNGRLSSQNTVLVLSNDSAGCKQNCWVEINKWKSLIWRGFFFSKIHAGRGTLPHKASSLKYPLLLFTLQCTALENSIFMHTACSKVYEN